MHFLKGIDDFEGQQVVEHAFRYTTKTLDRPPIGNFLKEMDDLEGLRRVLSRADMGVPE